MDNFVVTLARSNGSGGRQIAQLLANRLKISFYDKELLNIVSQEHGINLSIISQADETPETGRFKKYNSEEIVSPSDKDYLSKNNIFNMTCQAMRNLADSGESCIILGRCAHHVLKDRKNVIRVFIWADDPTCAKNLMERHGIDYESALKRVRETDNKRKAYHRYFTNMEWTDVRNYDICLNTGTTSIEECVEVIINYINMMKNIK